MAGTAVGGSSYKPLCFMLRETPLPTAKTSAWLTESHLLLLLHEHKQLSAVHDKSEWPGSLH